MVKTYSELITFPTFEERFAYLRLDGVVGETTFGNERNANQAFYASKEWRDIRNFVLVRDDACDLGIPGFDIGVNPTIHHITPMTKDDVIHGESWILDPEHLITTSKDTHNAIHYGGLPTALYRFKERRPNDTKLW